MIDNALHLFQTMDIYMFVRVFWYWIVFDFARYVLSLGLVVVMAMLGRLRPVAEPEVDPLTPVSVLLVGHNEGDSLERTVMSLREQTMTRLQIVVVNDGSTDNMAQVGHALQTRGLIDIFLSNAIRGGKASALNTGFRYCRHDFMVCADIDTTFDRDALEQIIKPMIADPEVGAVSGNLGVRNGHDSLATSIQTLEYLDNISLGRRFNSLMDIMSIVSGAFGAFRRDVIRQIGGWEVGPGDDSILTHKIRRAGHKVRFAHKAWALTDVPVTFSRLARQRLRWNRSIVRIRMRQFRDNLNPFSKRFSGTNLLAAVNIIFFQVIMALSFFVYTAWLFWAFGAQAWVILIVMAIFYLLEDLVTFTVVTKLYPQRKPLEYGLYIYLIGFYRAYFLRLVRFVAYLSELIFRHSFTDSFYPEKVRRIKLGEQMEVL